MSTVSAYAATSATEPLTKTTIERRELGPHDVLIDIKYAGICHSDIHAARGEWGGRLPAGARPRDRRHRRRVGAEVTRFKVGDRVGVGCMVDSCGECEQLHGRGGAVLQPGATSDLQRRSTTTARRPTAATPGRSSSTRTSCCASPTAAARRRRAAAVRRHHAVLAAAALEAPAPARRSPIVGLGGLGHMGVKIAAALGAEVTVLVAVAEQEGGRPAPRRRATTTRPATRRPSRSCAGSFDLILNTVSANLRPRRLPRACSTSTARWSTSGVPEQPMAVPRVHAGRWRGAAWPARRSAASPRPRRCSTSAPSTASAPRSRSSRPTRSTRPTSACSPATCATASSSTSRRL